VAALLQNRKREIALIDVSTGDELATLVAPDALDITGLCFSRDGSRLVACCGYQHALQIWDLRAIREGLAERKLAGSWPAYPASNSAAPVSPLGVELVQK